MKDTDVPLLTALRDMDHVAKSYGLPTPKRELIQRELVEGFVSSSPYDISRVTNAETNLFVEELIQERRAMSVEGYHETTRERRAVIESVLPSGHVLAPLYWSSREGREGIRTSGLIFLIFGAGSIAGGEFATGDVQDAWRALGAATVGIPGLMLGVGAYVVRKELRRVRAEAQELDQYMRDLGICSE